ncbi:hypothetical protein JCM8208_002621 [Rhodotorula glutinis]
MKNARRKGAAAPGYNPSGLVKWFSRLDLSYFEPVADEGDRTATCSQLPLSDLEPIRVADMDTTKKYSGRYLLCRAKGAPFVRYGLAFPVEDQDGSLFIVYLRNYPVYGVKQADLDKLYLPGTGLLIREPAFTLSTDGLPSDVRVSSPTDVEVYKSDSAALADVEWATASPFRPAEPSYDPYAAGQAFIEAKLPYLAVQAFTEAIARAETQERTVHVTLERANAHLKAGQPAAAYHDTSIVLMYLDMGVEVPFDERVAVLSARNRALTAMGLHDLAELVADDHISLLDDEVARLDDIDKALGQYARSGDDSHLKGSYPDGEDHLAAFKIHMRIKAARSRQAAAHKLKEQCESGVYDLLAFEQARDTPLKPPCDRLEYQNYVGPIRVAQLKKRNGGRGVIATRDIKPGELLLVEKAFTVADYGTVLNTSIGEQADQVPHRPKATLAVEVAARVLDDPSTLPILESLFNGRDPPKQPLVFDALSKRSIPKYASAPINLDMDWVERICAINGFNFMPPVLPEYDSPNLGAPGWRDWSALFINGAAFNHSCLPNTYHKSVGDLLVVRARVGIKKGKEVYVSYAPIDISRSPCFSTVLERHFGPIGCPCAYCVDIKYDDDEDMLDERERLLDEFYGNVDLILEDDQQTAEICAKHCADLSRIIADIDDTYTGDGPVKPELVEPYAKLVQVACGDLRRAVAVSHRAITAFWSRAVVAAGASPDMSGDVWEFEAAPLCHPEHVLGATLHYARACDAAGSPSASSQALSLLTLAANQSRVEHGDGLEQFWRRWRTDLVGLEQYKERLAERMAEGK